MISSLKCNKLDIVQYATYSTSILPHLSILQAAQTMPLMPLFANSLHGSAHNARSAAHHATGVTGIVGKDVLPCLRLLIYDAEILGSDNEHPALLRWRNEGTHHDFKPVKIFGFVRRIFPSLYDSAVTTQPNPYFTLRPKLIDEASGK